MSSADPRGFSPQLHLYAEFSQFFSELLIIFARLCTIWSVHCHSKSMQRREFLKLSGGATFAAATARVNTDALAALADGQPREAVSFYVSPSGNDQHPGTCGSAVCHSAPGAVSGPGVKENFGPNQSPGPRGHVLPEESARI